MFYAINKLGKRIHISEAAINESYFCPFCNSSLIAKNKGSIVSHHFAHLSNKNCDSWYSNKISDWHSSMQQYFPEHMREIAVYNDPATEFHIADIMFTGNSGKHVFEFQHSSIPVDDFVNRSIFYINLGYSLTWVFDYRNKFLYYTNIEYDESFKHFHWPGRDRVRFFESSKVRDLFNQCLEYGLEFNVIFQIRSGLGAQYEVNYGNGFVGNRWEYKYPLLVDELFIRPEFIDGYSMEHFYAKVFSRDNFLDYIDDIMG